MAGVDTTLILTDDVAEDQVRTALAPLGFTEGQLTVELASDWPTQLMAVDLYARDQEELAAMVTAARERLAADLGIRSWTTEDLADLVPPAATKLIVEADDVATVRDAVRALLLPPWTWRVDPSIDSAGSVEVEVRGTSEAEVNGRARAVGKHLGQAVGVDVRFSV